MSSDANGNSGAPPTVCRLANWSLGVGVAYWIALSVLTAYEPKSWGAEPGANGGVEIPSAIPAVVLLLAAVLPFVVIVSGHIALSKIKRSDRALVGKWRARIGLLLGYLPFLVVAGLVALLIWYPPDHLNFL